MSTDRVNMLQSLCMTIIEGNTMTQHFDRRLYATHLYRLFGGSGRMTLREKLWFAWILFWLVIFLALAIIHISTLVQAQGYLYGGPPMWDRGPNPEYRQERRLPERSYDPYDRGSEERHRGQQPIDREEYERRAYCAMHPRDCQRYD